MNHDEGMAREDEIEAFARRHPWITLSYILLLWGVLFVFGWGM